ncbi:helix-turn-helix transcriptional regulator [Listeria costaricensis]|uniref:helix-turn-helix transcriptional regulator n=1 Tax=Listeria costaricensis TaxID=2026604 RepID=UPI000C078551|nr:YafY family protein [Listeria costaricensis]
MKIERLIGIVMLLLQRELVSAAEMARMFEVSKRTIYRDIETLSMARIPIYTLAGTKGGIGIMPTYKVDKKLLTVDDLTAILTSLDGFEQLLASAEIKNTLRKIRNMLGEIPESAAQPISLDFSTVASNSDLNQLVEQLHLAIKKERLVTLVYIDRNGRETTRQVEPYHLLFRNRFWYLQGYSLDRADFRTFKLSRIIHWQVEKASFIPRPFDKRPFSAGSEQAAFSMQEVRLIVDKIGREQIVERFDRPAVEALDDGAFLVTLSLPNHEAGYRFLLQLGTHVTLLNEDDFYEGFHDYLNTLYHKYQ